MTVELKSIKQYKEQSLIDIESKTNQNTPPVAIAYNRIIANAVSALTLINGLHNIDQRKECFPQTATEKIGLPLWAELTNRPRGSAIAAQHTFLVTGTNGEVVGTLEQGPVWIASDGSIYDTTIGGIIAGGELIITIKARQSGEQTTLSIGAQLSLSTTLPGINSIGEVLTVETAGAEQETIDSWRTALIQKAAFPDQIGVSAWFYEKALEIDGITRVFPYSSTDFPGRVLIYAVADDNVDGIPTAGQLQAIEDNFITAGNDVMWSTGTLPNGEKRIEAFASEFDIYDVVITEGSPFLSVTLKVAIELAINNYFLTRSPYIKGLSFEDAGSVERAAIITVAQNTIEAEVGEVGRFTDIALQKQGETAADVYTLDPGKRALANISYT